jgi:arylsulfatase A-like enzyme/Flp pilus assembly protein TadD
MRRLFLAASVLVFCEGSPAQSPPGHNVILVTIDTLRADHLRCYGYRAVETPTLDGLAQDGIRFAQAISECPITLPSHCSILTGTYPLYHGVRDNSGYRLPQAQLTLAEVLKQRGYRTGAFVGAFVLDSSTGLTQGFDVYVDGFRTSSRIETDLTIAEHRAGKVVASALNWLRQARPGEKSFAWIHLFDPHAPYNPPAPYSARYSRNLYDGEIAYVDSSLEPLIAYLKAQNLYAESLLTVIGDHGEGLGDHAESTHGMFLYDSTLRVPWLLKPPRNRFAGRVVTEQVQSIDLMPTLLQFLGIQIPSGVQGVGLLSFLEGKNELPRRYALGETLLPRDQYGWSPLLSVRTAEKKLVQAPRPELYDLTTDPREQVNVYESNQGIASQLKQQRSVFAAQFSGKGASQARIRTQDPEAFQRLLGLGYLAVAGAEDTAIDTTSLPDPKDRIQVFDLLWAAQADNENKHYDAASEKLRRALATDSKIYFAHALLGVTYSGMGRFPDAAQELKVALSLRPGDIVATFYLGSALSRMGQNDAAERAFQRVLELDPSNDGALNNLGIVAMNQKRYDEAAKIYRRLIAVQPRDSFAWTNLGLAYMNQGRNEDAVAALSKALGFDPKVPQIENNLGLALMNLGKPAEAIRHYRQAIALDADYGQAHYNLALALKKQGLDADAEREMLIARRLLQK